MKEALKLALEALTQIENAMPFPVGTRAITAIREALAQPQQEPVADALIRQYVNALLANNPDEAVDATKAMVDYTYTSPPARKPLDGSEVERILKEQPNGDHVNLHWFYNALRAIEAAHGIKG